MAIFDGLKNAFNFISNFPDMSGMFETVKDKRVQAIDERIDYREGRQKPQLKVKLNKPDDNITNNIIGRAIEQSKSLLLSKGVEFDLDDDKNQEWIDACWKANKKTKLMNDGFLNAADADTGYIKIQEEGVEGEDGVMYPRMILLDSRWVTMFSNPEDHEQIIKYRIEYSSNDENGKERKRRQDIEKQGNVYDDVGNLTIEGESWLISDYQKGDATQGKWQLMTEPVVWEYKFAPIVNWKNLPNPNDIHGRPDADKAVINIQDKLNFNLSNLNKIIRYNAHPRTIGRGIGKGSDLKTSPNSMWNIPAEADVFNLEMKSDLSGALDTLDYLGKAILDNMAAVDINNIKDKSGQLTNFAIQVLFHQALSKMQDKREIWTEWLTDMNERLFTVAGMENVDVGDIVWPDSVLPVNNKEQTEIYKSQLEMGIVSKETISTKTGYDWEVEQERIASGEEDVGEILIRNFNRNI